MRASVTLFVVPLILSAAACGENTVGVRNAAPEVSIVRPDDGWEQPDTEPLLVQAWVEDSFTSAEDLVLQWSTSVDGPIEEGFTLDTEEGFAELIIEQPTAGEYTITLRATDDKGAEGSDSVSVIVNTNNQPVCSIATPSEGAVFNGTGPWVMQGQVSDVETPLEELTISWTSDLDDALEPLELGEAGAVSVETELSPGVHTLTLAASDPQGLACEDSVSLRINQLPPPPVVALQPDPPSIASDLSLLIVTDSEDPDGDEVEYRTVWKRDGDVQPALTGDSVPAAELAHDQQWTVEVYASDPYGENPVPGTAALTVPNTAPTAPVVSVTPADPSQAVDLVCVIDADSTDADPGDTVSYTYQWLRNGTATGVVAATLPWSETAAGETWTCSVTPSDGAASGLSAEDSVPVHEACSALDFADAGDFVEVSDDPALSLSAGDYTVEAWVRPTGPAADQLIVGRRGAGSADGWALLRCASGGDCDGSVRFVLSRDGDPAMVGDIPLDADAWNHVAVVYSGAQGTLYVDGVEADSTALPSPSASTLADLTLGGDSTTSFTGTLDAVRISSVARYGADFTPAAALPADSDTVALWGFEEDAGAVTHDLSEHGHDGTLSGSPSWSGDSVCDLDRPPTAPEISVTPEYPVGLDALDCVLDTPAVDPDGGSVSYAGQWLVDGQPSGVTFSGLPHSLPASSTSAGEQWTCEAWASDGALSSPTASDSVWVETIPVCVLTVTDPTNPTSTTCPFEAPVDGILRYTMSNPDGSLDGIFVVDAGAAGQADLFTGFRDWVFRGPQVTGWVLIDQEMNVDVSMGAVNIVLSYITEGGSEFSGADELIVDFVPHARLTTAGATLIAQSVIQDGWDVTPTQVSAVIPPGARVMTEALYCGTGGGAQAVYADDDAIPNNDGIMKVSTGSPGACNSPLRSMPLAAGSYNFNIVNEDDYHGDNTGPRGIALYYYVP